jgi:hypothetical protein
MDTLRIYNPCLFPGGKTYRVRACYRTHIHITYHDTQRDALDARDAAFDAGAVSVHVTVSDLPPVREQ